jgi:hypothetical protein
MACRLASSRALVTRLTLLAHSGNTFPTPAVPPQNDLANAAEWPLADMADRCPEAEWEGQEPYVPKATMFEAFYPVVPDIYPGGRA